MKIEEKMSYQAPELEEAKYGAFVAGTTNDPEFGGDEGTEGDDPSN